MSTDTIDWTKPVQFKNVYGNWQDFTVITVGDEKIFYRANGSEYAEYKNELAARCRNKKTKKTGWNVADPYYHSLFENQEDAETYKKSVLEAHKWKVIKLEWEE